MTKLLVSILAAPLLALTLHAADNEGLQLSGFEDSLGAQWKHQNPADTKIPFVAEKSPEKVKEGAQSAKWQNLVRNKWIELANTPKDWTPYTALSIWIFAETANSQKINLTLPTHGESGADKGYYHYQLKIDWTGWRQLVIPLELFKPHRNPAPLSRVSAFRLSSGGWDTEALPDTVLYLDDLRLLP